MEAKRRLVPYYRLSPDTRRSNGERSALPVQEDGWPITRFSDGEGNVIAQWSVWTWTPLTGKKSGVPR